MVYNHLQINQQALQTHLLRMRNITQNHLVLSISKVVKIYKM